MMNRYPDKEAGQFPMAYVVRKDGSSLSESQVMNFVAEQVGRSFDKHPVLSCFTVIIMIYLNLLT